MTVDITYPATRSQRNVNSECCNASENTVELAFKHSTQVTEYWNPSLDNVQFTAQARTLWRNKANKAREFKQSYKKKDKKSYFSYIL